MVLSSWDEKLAPPYFEARLCGLQLIDEHTHQVLHVPVHHAELMREVQVQGEAHLDMGQLYPYCRGVQALGKTRGFKLKALLYPFHNQTLKPVCSQAGVSLHRPHSGVHHLDVGVQAQTVQVQVERAMYALSGSRVESSALSRLGTSLRHSPIPGSWLLRGSRDRSSSGRSGSCASRVQWRKLRQTRGSS